MIVDVVVSVALFFVGKYAPVAFEDIKFLIITIQPVIISVIVGIAVEDSAYMNNIKAVDSANTLK
jgi:hypothetical protein